jgi:hypothetical protein
MFLPPRAGCGKLLRKGKTESDMPDSGGLALIFLAGIMFLVWFTLILPAQMAGARGRSAILWVLISIVGSPILAILLLLALGDARTR